MHVILGINGTVGPYLAEALHQRNLPVRGISRREFKGQHWEHVQADVLNLAELIAALEGAKVVYLVVGIEYNIQVWRRDWPIVMENTIEACKAHGAKLVFLDNVYPYGLVKGTMTEKTPYHPNSKKGELRKQLAERLMHAVEKEGLNACIARAADFYGPRANNTALYISVVQRHLTGKKAQWVGDPKTRHTYTYSLDMGEAMAILGTDARADGQVWHLPSSQENWTAEAWIRRSAEICGAPQGYMQVGNFMLKALGLFMPMMREIAEMNYQFNHDYLFSSDKFEKTFGFKPTKYADGLAEMIQFYKR